MWMKEITGKTIVCNFHRFLQFLVIDISYRAKKVVSSYWFFLQCNIFKKADAVQSEKKGD